jgi:outer membrane protein OmpA-like peptidoglycan-associated protein|tara:strand:- start:20346 stop:20975 length:630 start_codon:yes stop_codon:yes gene_type:complete
MNWKQKLMDLIFVAIGAGLVFLGMFLVGCGANVSELREEKDQLAGWLAECEGDLSTVEAQKESCESDLVDCMFDPSSQAGQGALGAAAPAGMDSAAEGAFPPFPPPPVYFFFGFDSAEITTWFDLEWLRYVRHILEKYSYHLVIDGYACTAGSPEYNMALSKKRAEALFDHLVGVGIDKSRLHLYYHGELLACGECEFDRRGLVTFVEK